MSSFELEDRRRLTPHNRRVALFMADHVWRTPYEIGEALGIRNAGTVTSRLRDIAASGVYDLERERVSGQPGVHRYRLSIHKPEQLTLLEAVGA